MRILALCFMFIAFSASAKNQDQNRHGRREADNSKDETQQPILVIQNDASGGSDRGAEAKEKVETDRKLAEYTGQLADYTKALVWATGIIAGLGFLQFLALYGAFRESKNAGKQAMRSANVAKKALILGNRPWLTVKIIDITLSESKKKTTVAAKFSLTNVGPAPAKHIVPHVFVFHGSKSSPEVVSAIQEQIRLRSKMVTEWNIGDVLFPNQSIENLTTNGEMDFEEPPWKVGYMIACVATYAFAFDPKRTGYTTAILIAIRPQDRLTDTTAPYGFHAAETYID